MIYLKIAPQSLMLTQGIFISKFIKNDILMRVHKFHYQIEKIEFFNITLNS
jgi:hypothetical protein